MIRLRTLTKCAQKAFFFAPLSFEHVSCIMCEGWAMAQFIAFVCHKLGFSFSIKFDYIILFDRNKAKFNLI